MKYVASIRMAGKLASCTILLASGLLMSATAAADGVSFQTVRDCDNSAVINCGALSTSALINAYNAQSYVRSVYDDVGISSASIKNLNATAQAGVINAQGAVYIHNQSSPVATNTYAVSRQTAAGAKSYTIKGTQYYDVAPNQVFTGNDADVYIVMKGGSFLYAIIASNGDPVLVSTPAGSTVQSKPPVITTPTKTSSPPKATTKLPTLTNTGPGTDGIIGLFVSAVILGGAYRYYRTIKRLKNSLADQ